MLSTKMFLLLNKSFSSQPDNPFMLIIAWHKVSQTTNKGENAQVWVRLPQPSPVSILGNVFAFLLAKWMSSIILKQKEAIESADVAKGVKGKMTTGNWRGRKLIWIREKQWAGVSIGGNDIWEREGAILTPWKTALNEHWQWLIKASRSRSINLRRACL